MKPAFSQTEISTGTNSDDDAFFANALANPPIPADLTLAQLEMFSTRWHRSIRRFLPTWSSHIDAKGASEGETRVSNPADALALLENLKATAALYLGSTDSKDPRANPLYADLTGLPPADSWSAASRRSATIQRGSPRRPVRVASMSA